MAAQLVRLGGVAVLAAGGCAVGVAMLAGAADRVPPPATGSTAIICHADEPGRRLLVEGLVTDTAGRPIRGASVGAYNTDATGLYNPPDSGTREPRISGTVITDAQGRFQILTVYPGAYPGLAEPAHVHFGATGPGYAQAWATIWIEGDSLLTAERRGWADRDEETRVVPAEEIEGLAVARVTIVMRES